MCSKHTRTKKWTPRRYPQRRKMFSRSTMKRLNKILYCQSRNHKNKPCNRFIPPGSPERQKHHIIPLSRGGTNNLNNILVCCIDCHYHFHEEEFKARGLTLEAFRARIYAKHYENNPQFQPLNQCREAGVGVYS